MGLILAGISLIVLLCGIRPYVVTSGSMEPTISTGSICFINTWVPYAEIEVGDVIAFYRGGKLITHRVVAITDHGLETQGDANDCSDGITTMSSNYHGKTIAAIPGLGYMVSFLQRSKIAYMLSVLLGAGFLWWYCCVE